MDFASLITSRTRCLTEGSIFEKLRRSLEADIDPEIFHVALIYDEQGSKVLEQAHRDYLDVGQRLGLPMMVTTDTWRANFERIERSKFHDRAVNQDDVRFVRSITDEYARSGMDVYVGGQIGPRGDAYKPSEALSVEAAKAFHMPQIEALCEGGVDFLFAATLPALSEARGIAIAMSETGAPYVPSFVVRRDGAILDGTPLVEVVRQLDAIRTGAPSAYFVNCVYPTTFAKAMENARRQDPVAAARVVGFCANTADLDPDAVDGSEELITIPPVDLAKMMHEIQVQYDIPIVGGCCGTDTGHIQEIGNRV